jgi:hypothetical protein
MHGATMDGQQGKFIESTQEMVLRFTSEISIQSLTWTQQIIDSPAELESLCLASITSAARASIRRAEILGMLAFAERDRVSARENDPKRRFPRVLAVV